jgi:hypothetical protein
VPPGLDGHAAAQCFRLAAGATAAFEPPAASAAVPALPNARRHVMIRYLKSAVAVAALVTAFSAADASAQIRLAVAGGPTVPLGELNDEFGLGYHVALSGLLGLPALPFDVRLEGAFNRFPEGDDYFQVISGTGNIVLNLPMAGLSPYIIGGLGAYNSRERHDDHFDVNETNLGMNIGAGVSFALPGLGLFIETRFHNVFSDTQQRYLPVSFGFRF